MRSPRDHTSTLVKNARKRHTPRKKRKTMPYKNKETRRAYERAHPRSRAEYSRKWHALHPNARKLSRLKRIANGKEQAYIAKNKSRRKFIKRRSDLRLKYGLTIEQYDQMHEAQGGRCAVCSRKTRLCVDHDHVVNANRKLLCGRCNGVLGYVKESVPLLRRMITYLKQFQEATCSTAE